MTAFEKYLMTIPMNKAVAHFYECLLSDNGNNMAWELMEKYNGKNWKCPPAEVKYLVANVLNGISMEYKNENNSQD